MFPEQTLLLYQPFGAKIVSSHRRRRAVQTTTFRHVNEQKTIRPVNKLNNYCLLLLVYIYNRQAEKYALTEL